MCLRVGLILFVLFANGCVSWICRFVSFINFATFSAIIYSNILFPPFSQCFLSATPIRFMWDIFFHPSCLLMFLYLPSHHLPGPNDFGWFPQISLLFTNSLFVCDLSIFNMPIQFLFFYLFLKRSYSFILGVEGQADSPPSEEPKGGPDHRAFLWKNTQGIKNKIAFVKEKWATGTVGRRLLFLVYPFIPSEFCTMCMHTHTHPMYILLFYLKIYIYIYFYYM